MEKELDLRRSLPQVISSIYEIGSILDAITEELLRLKQVISLAFDDLSISTTTSRPQLWEKELGLDSYPDLDISVRRALLLARLKLFETQRAESIKGMLMCYAPKASITVECPTLKTGVVATMSQDGYFPNGHAAVLGLAQAVPAHLPYSLTITSRIPGVEVPRTYSYGTYTYVYPINTTGGTL